ncbi:DUF5004 domain-containing protein [Flavobacterium sp. MFBS3-15]|uniref:DUF5004 domain-containing protein n=1 Tax=Flavobacterium sp. MFBS3-15 TaxID=2989816 RepID=UPI00223629A0|nr:DUF5004 domain-containing protein [Flavobacterium sp. MFBS3-15]MCW4468878.1 DUF5004 domain-containing protein [Flavobacterium sp. MFBS3-15]
MRRKITYGLAAILCSLAFVGCDEQDDGSSVDPITVYEKMNGDWGLMNLKMVDEFAKANNIQPNEQNLSTLFNYENFQINFSVDENIEPTTYQVTGELPPLFDPSGYWELSAAFQPTNSGGINIFLYSDAAKTQKTDELRLTSVPGSNGEMEIQLVRTADGTPFVSYVFRLNSLN